LTRSKASPACWPNWVCSRPNLRPAAVACSVEGRGSEGAIPVRSCTGWLQPPASPSLNWDDVHVWRIPLGLPQRLVADLASLLSCEENSRAEQFLVEEARRRFIVSHGATRRILSRYLDQIPEEIQFVKGGWGKPHLATPAGAPAICFSLSHSGELALCAVAEGRDIGVDIEQIRPALAWREIAACYFSAGEKQALRSLAEDQASEAFFRGWTRKEAFSKALGEGVSQRWTQFTVSLQPGAVAELVNCAPEARVEGLFTLCPIAPGSGYVAAIAAQGVGMRLSCWQLTV
jgi:4'-phosphopantetheinyl transferase